MEITQILQVLPEVLKAIGLIVGGATILARLTKTQKDDTVLEKIRKILERTSNLFLPDRK